MGSAKICGGSTGGADAAAGAGSQHGAHDGPGQQTPLPHQRLKDAVDQRTDRFIRVAAQVIAGRAADISHVDMRYSNGFSIGWRAGAGPQPDRAAASPRNEETDSDA